MIMIKVECDLDIQASIKECFNLVEKLGVGTTMEANGVTIECNSWDTFDDVYDRYTDNLREVDEIEYYRLLGKWT